MFRETLAGIIPTCVSHVGVGRCLRWNRSFCLLQTLVGVHVGEQLWLWERKGRGTAFKAAETPAEWTFVCQRVFAARPCSALNASLYLEQCLLSNPPAFPPELKVTLSKVADH